MKNLRKQIIREIELQNRKLQYHQIEVSLHKSALIDFLKTNKVTIIACMLPLFYFFPWKKLPLRALTAGSGLAIKQALRLAAFNAVSKKSASSETDQ